MTKESRNLQSFTVRSHRRAFLDFSAVASLQDKQKSSTTTIT